MQIPIPAMFWQDINVMKGAVIVSYILICIFCLTENVCWTHLPVNSVQENNHGLFLEAVVINHGLADQLTYITEVSAYN
jgi:hypothetical protein